LNRTRAAAEEKMAKTRERAERATAERDARAQVNAQRQALREAEKNLRAKKRGA